MNKIIGAQCTAQNVFATGENFFWDCPEVGSGLIFSHTSG
jgi:hypothetical protein